MYIYSSCIQYISWWEFFKQTLANRFCVDVMDSLQRRRFKGIWYFVSLLNQEQHSFPKLSQSHCTFQILDSGRLTLTAALVIR